MYKLLFFIICITGLNLSAQKTPLYEHVNHLEVAEKFFNETQYSAALRSYKDLIDQANKNNETYLQSDISSAKIGIARSAMRMEFEEGPNLLDQAIQNYYPQPISYPAVLELANHYYTQKDYKSAIYYYDLLTEKQLDTQEEQELSFKLGYCHFVRKDFTIAGNYFAKGINMPGKYSIENQYYYGMVAYFTNDYELALSYFRKIEHKKQYKTHIPYYISQIYFAQKQYNQLIEYATKHLKKHNIKNEKEIRLLVGQAYFIQKNFEKALPYLAYYESRTDKLSEEEFYQLGYTQYVLKQYEDATVNLIEIAILDNDMGMLANYYLADAYLKLNDKVSARTAFKKVSKMDLVPAIQEESHFNYAKLSAELGFDREAINHLILFSNHSIYREDAQSILSNLLLNTTDYSAAINTIEKLDNITPALDNTLTKLYFLKGLQLYNDGKTTMSKSYFTKVLQKEKNSEYGIQSRYYKALISYDLNEFDKSIHAINQYFDIYNKSMHLPLETSPIMANYLQAYNYLAKNEHKQALDFFKTGLEQLEKINDRKFHDQIYPDFIIRLADCAFKTQNRVLATSYYTIAMKKQHPYQTYAIFQLAIIKGLENKPYEKIVLLEKITQKDIIDDLTDDALYSLGDTYLNLQQFNKSFSNFKEIIQKHKQSIYLNQSFLKLGLISYNQGDVQDALIYYKEIFNHNPNPIEKQQALVSIEEIYIQDLGQADEYVLFTEQVVGNKISAFTKDSLNFHIAYNHYKNTNYSKGVTKFEHYIKNYKTGFYIIPAHYYKAESNALLRKYSASIKDYAIVIDAGQGDYFKKSLKKAALISFNHEEDFVNALKYYKLLYENSSDNETKFEAQQGALQSSYNINHSEDVKFFSTKVIQNPLATNKDKSKAFFYSGNVFYKDQKYDQAIPSFNQVVQLSNNENAVESKYLLADIFYKKQLFDKAQKQCLDISNMGSYPYWVAKSLILLSDILIEKLDFFNAKAALEAVIENYKDDAEITKLATDKLTILLQKEDKNSRLKDKNEKMEMIEE